MSKTIKTIRDLTPDDKNANRGAQRGSGFLEQSLEKFGAGRSILIDKNGRIIAGNKTVEGAASIGLEELIVVPTDGRQIVAVQRTDLDLDDPKTRELAVYDNRVGQVNLEWDVDVLAQLAADGVELDALWSEDELSELLNDTQEPVTGAGGDEFEAEPDEAQTRVKVGDLWQCGRHRVGCIDNRDAASVARLMGGAQAGLCLTDPPYGINASDMTMGKGQSSKPKSKRLSNVENWDNEKPDVTPLLTVSEYVCIWGGNYFADTLPVTNDWLCWHKKNDERSFSEFELAWTNYGGNCRHLSHHWGAERKEHITQKPIAVMAFAIEQCPDASGVIYDPYLGSGTTLIAAERMGRTCYGCDVSPKYVDVVLKRFEAETGEAPVKVE